MVIVGAKGFAKEVLEVLKQTNKLQAIAFYDDVNFYENKSMYDFFPIIQNESEVKFFFDNNDNEFTLGIGNPYLRHKLHRKFENIGGSLCSTISPFAIIGSYDVQIGNGCNILSNATLSNSVKLGIGCILYYNVIVAHDCVINDFVELSPNVTLLGNVKIDSFTQIGAGSTVLPNISIGKNVIIGAGSIVTKNIPNNCMAFGVPAKVVKKILPLNFK